MAPLNDRIGNFAAWQLLAVVRHLRSAAFDPSLLSELRPDLAEAHYKLAVAWARLGNYDSATNYCDHALRFAPELTPALADCAWLLATRKNATPQDLTSAVDLATRACRLTGDSDPGYLDTLAAAYAANGQFTNAVTSAEKALAIARTSGSKQLEQRIAERLNLYRAGQPYRAELPAALPSDW